jgi:ABC-type dipeptide/oligopeptide/nickel transport system ATPase subunit
MQSFDIVKENEIEETFRVSKIKSDFDLKNEHCKLELKGSINIPDSWNIGVITGGSGTGKSTIAKELFKEKVIIGFEYTHKSVIDDMPKVDINEIEKMFYSVGLGSVPSWLKPYKVLSTGEKMRVDLARALLENDFVVYDEFTSTIDRQVAKVLCIALNKTLKQHYPNKKLIAVSCHKDFIEWLQPDWYFDTDTGKTVFQLAHDPKRLLKSESVTSESGQSLGNITI